MPRSAIPRLVWIISCVVGSGCSGNVTGGGGSDGVVGQNPGPTPGTPSRPGNPSTPGNPGTPGSNPDTPDTPLPDLEPAPAFRLVRLTHPQWTRSVASLFQLGSSAPTWAESFRSDAQSGGFLFDNDAENLVVDEALQTAYQRAAEQVATYVTASGRTGWMDRHLPVSGEDRDRARSFIESFGLQVHRRPLEPADVNDYLAVYDVAVQYRGAEAALTAGLRLLTQAFLSSPRFLYRFESSTNEIDGQIPLDGFEIASRLSFGLWNASPDDLLLSAAAEGRLQTADDVRREASRMLDDPRAGEVNRRYHDFLLNMARYSNIGPDAEEHPEATANLPASAREETYRVLDTAFEEAWGWRSLLTTNETWVNDELAALYRIDAPGTGFRRVELPIEERRGIFTQVGFLAANATRFQPDPIHRGVFLTERIACNALGAPPANLPPLPPPEGRTNREVVTDHTEQPNTVCASCHTTLINPFGFVYENYDAAGRIRTVDNGQPVDTQAAPSFGGAANPVSDAVELADLMADSEAIHACYAQHWTEYLLGRKATAADRGWILRLARRSLDGASIRELLLDLVTSPAFLNRSLEEI